MIAINGGVKLSLKNELKLLIYITIIGLVFPISTKFFPMVAVISFLFAIPFMVIGARSMYRRTGAACFSLIAGGSLLTVGMMGVDMGLMVLLTYIWPGFIMGMVIDRANQKTVTQSLEYKKSMPFLYGVFIFFAGAVIYYTIEKLYFGRDTMELLSREIAKVIEDGVSSRMQSGSSGSTSILSGIDAIFISNIIPGIVIIRSMFLALISYYLGNRYLTNLYPRSYRRIEFKKFVLPKSAAISVLIFFLLTIGLGYIFKGFKSEAIISNLQIVFMGLFAIQGLALLVHLMSNKNIPKISKILIVFAVFILSGFFGLGIVGLMDSIFNFRKLDRMG